jgi:hypothetical protein
METRVERVMVPCEMVDNTGVMVKVRLADGTEVRRYDHDVFHPEVCQALVGPAADRRCGRPEDDEIHDPSGPVGRHVYSPDPPDPDDDIPPARQEA